MNKKIPFETNVSYINKDMYIIRSCELAAIMVYPYIGCKDSKKVDEIAVDSLRKSLNASPLPFLIKVGEGYLDKAPELYIGEKLGKNSDKYSRFDVAVDPVDGSDAVAFNQHNSLIAIAYTYPDKITSVPDGYMEKIFIASHLKKYFDKNLSFVNNVLKLKTFKDNLSIVILRKPRHLQIIERFKQSGIKVYEIDNGDVLGAIEVTKNKIDVLYGIGGNPEGILMACLAIASDCFFSFRFIRYVDVRYEGPQDDKILERETKLLSKENLEYEKLYVSSDLVKDPNARFVGTYLTESFAGPGVVKSGKDFIVHSFFASHGVTREFFTTFHESIIERFKIKS